MGCLTCFSTTPTAEAKAPVSMSKGIVKSGNLKTLVVVIASFNFVKETFIIGYQLYFVLVKESS